VSAAGGGRARLIAGLAALAAIGVALLLLPVAAWLDALRNAFERLGPWGIGLFVIVYAAAAILFVPGSALTIGAGVIYGLWRGCIAVSAGSTLGAAGAFLISRYAARAMVERWAAANPRFAAIDRALGRDGWKIVLLTRLSPVFPFTLLNYLYGLTRVKFGEYVLASWIGMMPGTVLYVYLGVAGGALAETASGRRSKSPGEWTLFVVGLLSTLAVTLYVTRLARRELRGRADLLS
jgi:uncharacterized membrane protein YdjX (TVP38/TMEM64 family)